MPAKITNVPITWTVGPTLAQDETWQCRHGQVELSTDAAPADGDGILLMAGQGWPIKSGLTVRYRNAGTTAAVITRQAN